MVNSKKQQERTKPKKLTLWPYDMHWIQTIFLLECRFFSTILFLPKLLLLFFVLLVADCDKYTLWQNGVRFINLYMLWMAEKSLNETKLLDSNPMNSPMVVVGSLLELWAHSVILIYMDRVNREWKKKLTTTRICRSFFYIGNETDACTFGV